MKLILCCTKDQKTEIFNGSLNMYRDINFRYIFNDMSISFNDSFW